MEDTIQVRIVGQRPARPTRLRPIFHTAVWTGSEMIVWGGYDGQLFEHRRKIQPSTDSWIATSTTNAPDGRDVTQRSGPAVEMVIWGGFNASSGVLNTGGRYNPGTDSWIATSTTNAPAARERHTAVWTGSEMIVWGGSEPGDLEHWREIQSQHR